MVRRAGLFVGVNRCWIGDWGPLRFAESDCRKLAKALQESPYSFPAERLRVWTASSSEPSRQPVRNRLLYGPLLPDGAGAELDLFVFFFAGHGVEVDGTPYLVPVDGVAGHVPETCVPLAQLLERISAIPARQRLLLFDTCFDTHADTGTRGPAPGLPASFPREAEALPSAVVLTSCNVGEVSYESEDLEAGLFTHFWTRGLTHCARTAADGRVTVFDVEKYAEEQVRECALLHGRRQQPQIWVAKSSTVFLTPPGNSDEYGVIPPEFTDRVTRTENIIRVMRRVLSRPERFGPSPYVVRSCGRLSAFAISDDELEDPRRPELQKLYLEERECMMALLAAGAEFRVILTWHTLLYELLSQQPPLERFHSRLLHMREFCQSLLRERDLVKRFIILRLPLSERNLLVLGEDYFFEGRKLKLGHGFDATRLTTDREAVAREVAAFDALFDSGVTDTCERWDVSLGRRRNGRLLEILIQQLDEELANISRGSAAGPD